SSSVGTSAAAGSSSRCRPTLSAGDSRARAAACSAADRCTIRLVLVRIPSRCASTIPRLTPWLKPKSSAVTMSSLTRGSFGEGRSERPEPGFEIHQLADAPLGAVVQQRHGRPDDAMGVARTLRRVKQEVQRPLIGKPPAPALDGLAIAPQNGRPLLGRRLIE